VSGVRIPGQSGPEVMMAKGHSVFPKNAELGKSSSPPVPVWRLLTTQTVK